MYLLLSLFSTPDSLWNLPGGCLAICTFDEVIAREFNVVRATLSHFLQTGDFRHFVSWWPNFWQLKQRGGLGMYGLTLMRL